MAAQCLSCGGIEGFTNDYLPTQRLLTPGVAPPPEAPYIATEETGFMPYMKADCSYATQACIYTAQGSVICPKQGLGNCGAPKR